MERLTQMPSVELLAACSADIAGRIAPALPTSQKILPAGEFNPPTNKTH
jgi:hypothetical protein